MANFAKTAARLGFTATLLILASTFAVEAMDNGSGPSSGSYCEQQAKDDFNANANSCNNVLSDLPDQLAQCLSDAKDDYNRAKSACKSQARLDFNQTVMGGTVGTLNGDNGGGKGKGSNGLRQSLGTKSSLFVSN